MPRTIGLRLTRPIWKVMSRHTSFTLRCSWSISLTECWLLTKMTHSICPKVTRNTSIRWMPSLKAIRNWFVMMASSLLMWLVLEKRWLPQWLPRNSSLRTDATILRFSWSIRLRWNKTGRLPSRISVLTNILSLWVMVVCQRLSMMTITIIGMLTSMIWCWWMRLTSSATIPQEPSNSCRKSVRCLALRQATSLDIRKRWCWFQPHQWTTHPLTFIIKSWCSKTRVNALLTVCLT